MREKKKERENERERERERPSERQMNSLLTVRTMLLLMSEPTPLEA